MKCENHHICGCLDMQLANLRMAVDRLKKENIALKVEKDDLVGKINKLINTLKVQTEVIKESKVAYRLPLKTQEQIEAEILDL